MRFVEQKHDSMQVVRHNYECVQFDQFANMCRALPFLTYDRPQCSQLHFTVCDFTQYTSFGMRADCREVGARLAVIIVG